MSETQTAIQLCSVPPSLALYNNVRGRFVMSGSTLAAWCKSNGHNVANVRAALIGTWNGPEAKKLRARLIEDAGVVLSEVISIH